MHFYYRHITFVSRTQMAVQWTSPNSTRYVKIVSQRANCVRESRLKYLLASIPQSWRQLRFRRHLDLHSCTRSPTKQGKSHREGADERSIPAWHIQISLCTSSLPKVTETVVKLGSGQPDSRRLHHGGSERSSASANWSSLYLCH